MLTLVEPDQDRLREGIQVTLETAGQTREVTVSPDGKKVGGGDEKKKVEKKEKK